MRMIDNLIEIQEARVKNFQKLYDNPTAGFKLAYPYLKEAQDTLSWLKVVRNQRSRPLSNKAKQQPRDSKGHFSKRKDNL